MKLTPGKLAGMKAVSNERGVIAAAAMDQRGSLQKSLAKEKGSAVSDTMMEEFKILVSEVLTPHASAILLDPEWGLPASKRRAKNAGLLLAYEKTGYDKTGPGRLGDLLDHWSARRLKEAGADCVKILLYYTPFDPKDVNDKKHAWVERIGDECRANDIPFFLEFVGYEEGADEKGLEYAKKKPQIVTESMREFSKPRYGVDVLKVEVPVNMKFVEGTKSFGGEKAYTKKEAIDLFHKAADVATKPFIYLSAGRQQRGIQRDARTGGGIGREVQRRALRTRHLERWYPHLRETRRRCFPQVAGGPKGVKNINNVNGKLKAATSWHSIYEVEPALAHV
jgi:tagatose 1,6-diphosphate aldolase